MVDEAFCLGICGEGRDLSRTPRAVVDVFELKDTFYVQPKPSTLARWRDKTTFCFAVRAWQLITHRPGSSGYPRLASSQWDPDCSYGHFADNEAVSAAYERTRQCAKALNARYIVFDTPASFTPTQENIRRLERFFSSIERDGRHLVWQPQGVWSPERVGRLCDEYELFAAADPFSQKRHAARAYLRLAAAHYSDDQLLRIERFARRGATLCIFDTQDRISELRRLAELVA